jgi:thermitase
MSFGNPYPFDLAQAAIQDAQNAGIIIVAAGGNTGTSEITYPAAYPEVIAVSALNPDFTFAYYSSYGEKIAFCAPGTDVLSTMIGSGYAYYSGTSMAAPHVAGVAALMLEALGTRLRGEDIGLPAIQEGSEGLIDSMTSVRRGK